MIDGLSVLALIAARGGSKGLPGKNIAMLAGKPLIGWTIEAARASAHVDRLILSSDDPAIIEVARRLGCDAPFVRQATLATDEATSTDVVLDALYRVPGYDIVVLLQPTSPLRTAVDIDAALARMIESRAPACVTLRPVEDHPYWTYRMDCQGRLHAFVRPDGPLPQRRQSLPDAWSLNGAVYAARIPWFLERRSFLTDETVGLSMPASRSLDIDTAEDLSLAQRLIETRTPGRSA